MLAAQLGIGVTKLALHVLPTGSLKTEYALQSQAYVKHTILPTEFALLVI